MKIAVSSDEKTHLTDFVIAELHERGHETVLFGPLIDDPQPWPLASEALARAVARGQADQGVLFCYTGTGASIAANKVAGVRAALCADAQTAQGARWWNDANVLVISLRATSTEVAREILDAWFAESLRPGEEIYIQQVSEIEKRNA